MTSCLQGLTLGLNFVVVSRWRLCEQDQFHNVKDWKNCSRTQITGNIISDVFYRTAFFFQKFRAFLSIIFSNNRLSFIRSFSFVSDIYGTKWPFACWCAVNKLFTLSRQSVYRELYLYITLTRVWVVFWTEIDSEPLGIFQWPVIHLNSWERGRCFNLRIVSTRPLPSVTLLLSTLLCYVMLISRSG